MPTVKISKAKGLVQRQGGNPVLDIQGEWTVSSKAAAGQGAGTGFTSNVQRISECNGHVVTDVLVDIAGATSVASDLDIIGLAAGGQAWVTRVTNATTGLIYRVDMICAEVPVGGAIDIDLYSADEATGAYNGLVTDLTNQIAVVTSGGVWAAQVSSSQVTGANCPDADQYLYITSGAATAGLYTAGKFVIRLFGVRV